jgi:cytochrome oxidase assembly protein ShyY1
MPVDLQYNIIWFALAIFTGIIAAVATANALQSLFL